MKRRYKYKNYKKTSSLAGDIILAPFLSLVVAVPATIASILILFIFGLICGAIDPLGNIIDSFFNSLWFWNEKWDYAWTLYFSIIIGIIFEIVYTIVNIKRSYDAHHRPSAPVEEPKVEYDPWDYMTLEEKEEYLIKEKIWWQDYREREAERMADAERKRQEEYRWEVQHKLDEINDKLDQINRY